MMHGYFKMSNVLCCIVSDSSLFICKICVHSVSIPCPYRSAAISRHHRVQGFEVVDVAKYIGGLG